MPGILHIAMALRVVLATADALDVQVTAPLDCPDASAIARALQTHEVIAPAPGWQARLELASARIAPASGPVLRLHLVRPDGSTALDRPLNGLLPASGGDCEAAADAIALILERRLRVLTWSSAGRAPEAPAETASVHATSTPAAAMPPPSPRGPALTLLAGPSWASDGARALSPSVEIRVRLRGPLHLGLAVLPLGTTADQALPGGGRARLQVWPLALRALAEPTTGTWRPLAGLDAGVRIERGESTDIAQPAVRWRPVLLAGGSLGLAWVPHPRWRIAAEAVLSRLVMGRDFDVAGFGRVLPPDPWQAQAGLRLGYALWP